jgi:hypothetical protein
MGFAHIYRRRLGVFPSKQNLWQGYFVVLPMRHQAVTGAGRAELTRRVEMALQLLFDKEPNSSIYLHPRNASIIV